MTAERPPNDDRSTTERWLGERTFGGVEQSDFDFDCDVWGELAPRQPTSLTNWCFRKGLTVLVWRVTLWTSVSPGPRLVSLYHSLILAAYSQHTHSISGMHLLVRWLQSGICRSSCVIGLWSACDRVLIALRNPAADSLRLNKHTRVSSNLFALKRSEHRRFADLIPLPPFDCLHSVWIYMKPFWNKFCWYPSVSRESPPASSAVPFYTSALLLELNSVWPLLKVVNGCKADISFFQKLFL